MFYNSHLNEIRIYVPQSSQLTESHAVLHIINTVDLRQSESQMSTQASTDFTLTIGSMLGGVNYD